MENNGMSILILIQLGAKKKQKKSILSFKETIELILAPK